MSNWSERIEKYGPLVWRTVFKLVSHETDAADCYQETFIAAFHLSQRQKILSWSATLRHLAAIKAMDCLRKRYRNASLTSRHNRESTVPAVAESSQSLLENELADALKVALTEIDARQAEVFCMICMNAMTHQETADAINSNANHVGVLLHRARTALHRPR